MRFWVSAALVLCTVEGHAAEPLAVWLRKQPSPAPIFSQLVATDADWTIEPLGEPFFNYTFRVELRKNAQVVFLADVYAGALYNIQSAVPILGAEILNLLYPDNTTVRTFGRFLLDNRILRISEGRVVFVVGASANVVTIPGDRDEVKAHLATFDALSKRAADLLAVMLGDGSLDERGEAEKALRALPTGYSLLTLEFDRGNRFNLVNHEGSATESNGGGPRYTSYGGSSYGGMYVEWAPGAKTLAVTSSRGEDARVLESMEKRPHYRLAVAGLAKSVGADTIQIGNAHFPVCGFWMAN